MSRKALCLMSLLAVSLALTMAAPGWAEEPAAVPAASTPAPPTKVEDWKFAADTAWVMITAFLVFFMNLGFGCVEAGFCRAKNCVNILSKNFVVFAVSTLGFWIIGWGLMFGDGNPYYGERAC